MLHIDTHMLFNIDDGKYKEVPCKLSHLAQVLWVYCTAMNQFMKGDTLAKFANDLYSAGIITVELGDNPSYNAIEGQFIAVFEFLTKEEQYEKFTAFLRSLRSFNGPIHVAKK